MLAPFTWITLLSVQLTMLATFTWIRDTTMVAPFTMLAAFTWIRDTMVVAPFTSLCKLVIEQYKLVTAAAE